VNLKGGSQYQSWNKAGNPPAVTQQSGMDGFLRIVREAGSQANVVAFDYDGSEASAEHSISFDFRGLDGGQAGRADGMSFLLVPTDLYGEEGAEPLVNFDPHEEPNLAGAFGIGFDTFNSDADAQDDPEGMPNVGNHVSVHFDGLKLSQSDLDITDFDLVTNDPNVWHHADLQINGDDFVLTLIDGVDGSEYVISETVEGLSAIGTIRPVFAARTGGAADNYDIDNFLMDVSASGVPGDFNNNGARDVNDMDLLTAAVMAGDNSFDLDGDGDADADDRTYWIQNLSNTYFGDSNFDGEFSSSDFVKVFTSAKYETGNPANWDEGDWNGDGIFSSSDFVTAFIGAGYEIGSRPGGLMVVPEPSSIALILLGLFGIVANRRRRS
jgi:hypothetical protein